MGLSRLNVTKRASDWKKRVEASLTALTALTERHDALAANHAALAANHAALAASHAALVRQNGSQVYSFLRKFPPHLRLLAIRKAHLVTLMQVDSALGEELAGFAPSRAELVDWSAAVDMHWNVADRPATFLDIDTCNDWPIGIIYDLRLLIQTDGVDDTAAIWNQVVTSDLVANRPSNWPAGFRPEGGHPDVRRRRLMIALGSRDPGLVLRLHAIEAESEPPGRYLPFDEDPNLGAHRPARLPAEPRKRSVLFVNPAYYNFLHLADALRKRGWDAVSMADKDPRDEQTKYFHGFDLNLFDPDPAVYRQRLRTWFREAIGRFDMFHFHGIGTMSYFPDNWDTSTELDRVPWDVLEMKRRGAKIAYSITGCHDLVTPSTFEAWSPGMCPKCPWRDRPEICSDHRMAAWGWKIRQLADLICIETDPPIDFRDTPAVFREPLSFAVDPEHWHPDLARTIPVPDEWQEPKAPGEILIYHSVGNYEERSRNGVNVKGTGAVIRAIDRLKSEGHPVRLLFRREVPSIHNRWMLAQADIIVDQLNYGRYGATAREGLMLGRPVVGRLNKVEPRGLSPVRCIAESPIVDASAETVYEVLKRLVENPEERARIGEVSRAHALKWWSKDVLAERYERVYDHLRAHGCPPATLG